MPSDEAVRALLSSPPENISLRDRDDVLKKASALAQAGVSDLHIIADFDFTLTRFRLEDGERSASTHACIETYKGLSQDYRMATRKLFEHYYPIEVSDISYEDKRKAMVEWWTQAHDLMIEAGLRRESLREMAKHPRLHLREGAVDLMRDAHEKDVPLHIFSAGLYDVIHAYIEVHGLDKYSPHVVSNMMEFDNTGVLKGFKGTLIHTLNKNSAALRSSPGWKRVESRKSVLLLGDNIGDVNMAKGLPEDCTVLNVGFLNDRIEERRAEYANTYDIVIEGDPNMDFVIELFQALAGGESS